MSKFSYLIIIFVMAACLPALAPIESARQVGAGERLLTESFDTLGSWSSYLTESFSIDVLERRYQMSLSEDGQFIWGTDGIRYDDTIIQVDVRWLAENDRAMTSVICRLQENGLGYYVVVSASGAFSIRYIGQNQDDALVRWQQHQKILQDDVFQMRVICVEDYIALYINGEYIDGAVDSRLSSGAVGLALGLPDNSPENAMVAFDNLRIWEASLP